MVMGFCRHGTGALCGCRVPDPKHSAVSCPFCLDRNFVVFGPSIHFASNCPNRDYCGYIVPNVASLVTGNCMGRGTVNTRKRD